MQSLSDIRALLDSRGLSPRKNFGQNFLIDHNLIRKLADAAGVASGDVVLEIGPGTGVLTDELLARGCVVVAAEIDRGLCDLLRERFATTAPPPAVRFTLVEGDCLAGKRAIAPAILEALAGRPFALVANLPYGAGTPVIVNLLADYFPSGAARPEAIAFTSEHPKPFHTSRERSERVTAEPEIADNALTPFAACQAQSSRARPPCRGLFVTIQREVADRLTAKPGTKDYGPLSILASAVADVNTIAHLPPECFWPRPDVHSSMVALTPRADPITNNPRVFFDFAQRLFEQRRKQLGAILGRDRAWPSGVSATARAEQLDPEQILQLLRAAS